MYWFIIVICNIFIQLITAKTILLNSSDHRKNSIVSCVMTIADNHFRHGNIVMVTVPISNRINSSSSSVMHGMLLSKLYNDGRYTVLTRRAKFSSSIKFTKKPHNYIIHIQHETEINETLYSLHDEGWHPSGLFIIISSHIFNNKDSAVAYITEILWTEKIMNFAILLPIEKDSEIFNIYTWFPYAEHNCGGNFNETVIINQCTHGIMIHGGSIFPNKVPKNLYGCPVYIGTVIWPPYVIPPKDYNSSEDGIQFTEGLEIVLINTIAKKANFTIVYSISNKTQDWGIVYANGSSTGIFKKVLDEQIDIAISALAPSINRYEYLDPSYHYSTETLTWCVPKASSKPNWMSIFSAFELEWWFLILLIYAMVSICLWSLSYWHIQEYSSYHSISSTFLNMLGVFVSLSVKTKPRIDSVRSLFLIWTFFSLILATIYQTNMIRSLVKPVYEQQINSIEEMLESNIPFGYLQMSRMYFVNPVTSIQKKLFNDSVICNDVYKCLADIAFYGNYCFVAPKLVFSNAEPRFMDRSGKLLIHRFDSDYVTFPVQMFSYKGFALLTRINELISRMTQTGLLKKWEDNVHEGTQKSVYVKSEDGKHILTLKTSRGAILFYVIGNSVAVLIFFLELVLNKYISKYENHVIPFTH